MSAAPASPAVTPLGRRVAGGLAAVGAVALTLQLLVPIVLTHRAGGTTLTAVWRFFGYFTILTNLLVVATLVRAARRPSPSRPGPSASTITGVVLAIVVVGLVYEGVLSGRVPEMGPFWWIADRLLHYAMPACTLLWWLAFVTKHTLGRGDPPRWLAYPLAYLVYALARGAIDGWYPYFFIDVSILGYGRALLNAVVLSTLMLVAGYVVVGAVAIAPTRRPVRRGCRG